jgi:hypothetical protein
MSVRKIVSEIAVRIFLNRNYLLTWVGYGKQKILNWSISCTHPVHRIAFSPLTGVYTLPSKTLQVNEEISVKLISLYSLHSSLWNCFFRGMPWHFELAFNNSSRRAKDLIAVRWCVTYFRHFIDLCCWFFVKLFLPECLSYFVSLYFVAVDHNGRPV